MKHFLNISEIASYTGFNTYDPVSAFERFIKKYDSDYKKCIEKLNQDVSGNRELAKQINENIKKDNELGLDTSKLEKKLETIENTISATTIEINKTVRKDIIIKEKLGADIVDKITLIENIDDRKKSLQEKIEKLDITKTEKHQLIKDSETFINTDHGVKTEDSQIQKYEKRYKIKLDVSQKYNCKTIRDNWFIGGKVDGLYIDSDNPSKNLIVEIKNRARGFFNGLRDYEKVQVQLYMWMLGVNTTHLVECYNGKQRTTKIYYDKEFINNILVKLDIFITNVSYFIEQPFDYKFKYISFKHTQKMNFLQQLYLTEISKVDLDDDIDSDTDSCMLSSL